MSSLAPKADFIGVEERVHLAAGGETPVPQEPRRGADPLRPRQERRPARPPPPDGDPQPGARAGRRAARRLHGRGRVPAQHLGRRQHGRPDDRLQARRQRRGRDDRVPVRRLPLAAPAGARRRGPLRRDRLRGAARRTRSRHRLPHPRRGALPRQLPDRRPPRSQERRRCRPRRRRHLHRGRLARPRRRPGRGESRRLRLLLLLQVAAWMHRHRRRVLEPPASAGLGARRWPAGCRRSRLDGEGEMRRHTSPRETTPCG